ncbi:hypothetical protein K490DRAFT_49227, partial [Saccharata proteae CBS 121410]
PSYSGGRDGVICAWDLNLDLRSAADKERHTSLTGFDEAPAKPPPSTAFRQQVQAHTHWINDIALAQNNQALVSASSDISVKLWRPAAQDVSPPQTIGFHSDYVKCLASPSPDDNWVASGGLDRKIKLWDLNGAGEKLQISGGEDANSAKGSIYALAATRSILASGGPESIVRVWDPRSGKRVTKFVGHTDNIRDVLIAEGGDTIMTASSDQTVKVWSMTAGRCMYTLTMHNDSVWSLYSDHPQLSVFYSSDRSGLVAKTDVRGCLEMDEGLSVAICQEHEGVNKVVNAGDYLWTATSSSSINRWTDVNTEADVQLPESYRWNRSSMYSARTRASSPPQSPPPTGTEKNEIPRSCILRMSHASSFYHSHNRGEESTLQTAASIRRPPEPLGDPESGHPVPCRHLPDFTIEGQHGLIKHVMLNDRRRVLTLDTAGEVMLWDLLQCLPVKSYGKRHLEDVTPIVNTTETVAHWCAVDTRTGSLTCVLEENYCFDAEMYADELKLEEKIDFREDQRINLGKWILRYLFANLIDEEIKRDEDFRTQALQEKRSGFQRNNAPGTIQIPQAQLNGWNTSAPTSASTLRASNGFHVPVTTPGLAIGVATPAAGMMPLTAQPTHNSTLPNVEEGTVLEKTGSRQSGGRTSQDGTGDYFSAMSQTQPVATPGTSRKTSEENVPASAAEPDKEGGQSKEGSGLFGRKLKMSMSFTGMKKLGRTQTIETTKPVAVDEKAEDSSDSTSSKAAEDRVIEDNFLGVVQRIRHRYEDELLEGAQSLTSAITPSLANETPVLKPPLGTTILIQEDRPDSGGVADLFEGQVGTLGQQADLIEKVAPMWLGEVLLRNAAPLKDIVKVSFILEPYDKDHLPQIASDGYDQSSSYNPDITTLSPAPVSGLIYKRTSNMITTSNNRLNANRMLRARKIMGYVAERIEPMPEHPDPDALKPEEYLELYCQNQLIPPTMTLATIRTHVWRGGGDVLLYYKANGRKEIKWVPPPPPAQPAVPQQQQQQQQPNDQQYQHQYQHSSAPSSVGGSERSMSAFSRAAEGAGDGGMPSTAMLGMAFR